MTFADLRKLVGIISGALDALESELGAAALDFPALDAPYDPASPAERALEAAAAAHAIDLVVAASAQLCAAVRKPALTVLETAWQHMLPAALRFVSAVDAVELLAEAGPRGMHVRDVAQKADVDQEKLAHALRFCATYHIFREVFPDVFANNRISSTLHKGKSFDALQLVSGADKYAGTDGLAAWLELLSSILLPAGPALTPHFTDPLTKHSKEPTVTALGRGAGFQGKTLFAWLEEHPEKLQTFGIGMRATTMWEVPDAIVEGFNWASLGAGSVVVDVGGGIGNVLFPLYEQFPHLRFEVQDRGKTCEHGRKVWASKYPAAISGDTVTFREHDFFAAQPRTDAAVFLVRHCAHNWPDDYVVKLLRSLRDAAQPSTRLLIADHVLPHACRSNAPNGEDGIPGAALEDVPEPLLPNLGRVCGNAYILDSCMQTFLNAKERTLEEHVDVLGRAGWKVERVNRVRGDRQYGHIVAVPAEVPT